MSAIISRFIPFSQMRGASFLSDRLTVGRSDSFVVGRNKDCSESCVSGCIRGFSKIAGCVAKNLGGMPWT